MAVSSLCIRPMFFLFIIVVVTTIVTKVYEEVKAAELVIKKSYVWGSMNGRSVKFSVDTGSSTCFANEDVVRRYCGDDFSGDGCDDAIVRLKNVKVSVRLETMDNFGDTDYIVLGRDFISAVGAVTFELGDAEGGWILSSAYKQGDFDGHSVEYLIDTGCDSGRSAIIKEDKALEICRDFEWDSDSTKFGGRSVTVHGNCWGWINVLGKEIFHRVRVMDDVGREDVLLCVDVIKQLGSLTFKLDDPRSARLLSGSESDPVDEESSSDDDDDDDGYYSSCSRNNNHHRQYYDNYKNGCHWCQNCNPSIFPEDSFPCASNTKSGYSSSTTPASHGTHSPTPTYSITSNTRGTTGNSNRSVVCPRHYGSNALYCMDCYRQIGGQV